MSGFTRDSRYYGDKLVYEALHSKWKRYHLQCGCENDWITGHAEPAGFVVVRRGRGFVALTGPGLTEDVDEAALTTNTLWQAVVGRPGTQDWFETVQTVDRAPGSESTRRAADDTYHAPMRERAAAAKTEPLTAAQLRYLTTLITKVSRDRLDKAFLEAVEGTKIAGRQEGEKSASMIARLTKGAARKLISTLVDV